MSPRTSRLVLKDSGDSEFLSLSFDGRNARIKLRFSSTDDIVELIVATNRVATRMSKTDERASRTCYVEVRRVHGNLGTENGRYVPSQDFAKMMKEERECFNFAYGHKESETLGILRLVGSVQLLSCLIESDEAVTLQGAGTLEFLQS